MKAPRVQKAEKAKKAPEASPVAKRNGLLKSAEESRTIAFIAPAGKKWKLTTTENKGKLFSTYLPL